MDQSEFDADRNKPMSVSHSRAEVGYQLSENWNCVMRDREPAAHLSPTHCHHLRTHTDTHQYTSVAVLGKKYLGDWPLIIWEETTAKRNFCRTN